MNKKPSAKSGEPLMEQADALVPAAHKAATTALPPLEAKFPFLNRLISTPEDRRWWDILVTIAGVYIASTRLRNLEIGEAREAKLMARVSEKLAEVNPNAYAAFEDCKEFFSRTFDDLTAAKHEERFIAADSIGLWITSNLLDRGPESQDELMFVRAIGVAIVHGFFRWWDKTS